MPQRHYTAHLDRLTIPVYSPLMRKLKRWQRVWITEQQYRVVARAAATNGWTGTQRELAAELGYTIGGLNDAINILHRLGIINRHATRGRYGTTTLTLQDGVYIIPAASPANVRYVVEKKETPRTYVREHLPDPAPRQAYRDIPGSHEEWLRQFGMTA